MRVVVTSSFTALLAVAAAVVTALDVSDLVKAKQRCDAGQEKECRKLADVARTDGSLELRKAATQMLGDPAVLASLARSAPSPDIRAAAVKNQHLTDAGVLAEVATAAPEEWLRSTALGRVTDPAVLLKIATSDTESMRRQAVGLLKDPLALLEVVATAPANSLADDDASSKLDRMIRLEITDQDVLAQIARAPRWPDAYKVAPLRTAAVKKLKDPKLLLELALDSPMVAGAAMEGITDEPSLAAIAIGAQDQFAGSRALEKVTAPERVEEIAASAKLSYVRGRALKRMPKASAALVNDVLVHAVREKQWWCIEDLARRNVRWNPESTAALKALAAEQKSGFAGNAARAMLAGLPSSSWPTLRVESGITLAPGALPTQGAIPPGSYTFSLTYRDYKYESRAPVSVEARIQAGRCYELEAGPTYGGQWSPRVVEKPCGKKARAAAP